MATTYQLTTRGDTARLERVRMLAGLMDTQFTFLGVRYGFDTLIGLFPLLGDMVAAFISLYIIWEARLMGVPMPVLNTMARNVLLDTLIGGIPLAGDLFDVFFKANQRNLALIENHLKQNGDALVARPA